jgi:hypothetical protein
MIELDIGRALSVPKSTERTGLYETGLHRGICFRSGRPIFGAGIRESS